jgi:serine/threonine protein kinase/tetratricopeptide (TPR) repeat protein
MTLDANSRLGGYTIVGLLGAGGMGEVYRARDVRLGREVALKILPADIATDRERRARFELEARAVAALNHPNIVTLYSLEDAGDALFITLELVDGETLAGVSARARLAVPALLRVAVAVADAVGCAHERGILHRDLKPANIMLGRDGRVKVLDFGLAKLKEAVVDSAIVTAAATVTRMGPETDRHTVVGTPDYMSPEQAENRRVDERSDIFSLGVVLYELASGERPFKGPSPLAVMSAILRDTPRSVCDLDPALPPALADVGSVCDLDPALPPALADVVRRCLCKDPAERYQTARALRDDLAALLEQVEPGHTPAPVPVAARTAPARRSVAVLPFRNLSTDPENEFFADGITEDLIAQLSKMRSVKVISRTSAMQFKNHQLPLRTIAETLGVATVVEGSVRKSGNRVRIVAELIDAETDEHLWAETYNRELIDIFDIQADVAMQIAESLKAELTPSERVRIGAPAPVNLEAYQIFLKGRQCLLRYTEAGFDAALGLFQRAVELDPGLALAHDGIALVYLIRGGGHGTGALRPREAYERARRANTLALQADPLCGDAHGTLGMIQTWADYAWPVAEESFRRGLDLSPGSAFMLDAFGLMLAAQERYDEAIAVQRHARELDPLASVIMSDLTTTYLRAGRLDEAVNDAMRLIDLDPAFPYGHSTLGWARMLKGDTSAGLDALRAAASLSPGNTLFVAQLGEALGLAGRRDEALEILATLEQLARERYVTPYHFAYVLTGIGENERALDVLEEAVEERAGAAYGIKGSFLFTTLRDHPRFKALLPRMNLDDRYRSGGVRFPKPR